MPVDARTISGASGGVIGGMFGLASFALFAAHDAIVKYLGMTYPVIQIVFFAALFGLPLLLAAMRIEGSFRIVPNHPWWVGARTVVSILSGLSIFYAFTTIPLAQVYAIIFATPLVITALSIPILGEHVGWRRWAAVAVGLVGVLIVLQPGSAPLGLGHLAALGAMLGGGFISITLRKIGRTERNSILILYPMVSNVVIMGALLYFWFWVPMEAAHLAMNAVMAALGFAAITCLFLAYRQARAAVVAPMQYSQIIWATVYGAAFFGEFITATTLIGAAVIIASGGFILYREGQTGRAEI